MSHITTVKGAVIKDVDAFIRALKHLGVNAQVGGTIKIHDGRHITNAAASANLGGYGVGLVAEGDHYNLAGDFQCFGWGLPDKFKAAMHAQGSDKDIQDTIIRYTEAETMMGLAKQEGYYAEMTEQDDGKIVLEISE